MSEKNRKATYDKLVKAKRFDDICESLKLEFGVPKQEPKQAEKTPAQKGAETKAKNEADKKAKDEADQKAKEEAAKLVK